MDQAPDTTTDTEPDDDALALTTAQERSIARSLASPLDQALHRGNARPERGAPSYFDAEMIARPSISLDPGNITASKLYEQADGFGVDMAVDALRTTQEVLNKFIGGRDALRTDPTLTEAARVLAVDDLFHKLFPTAAKKLDAASNALTRAIQSMEEGLRAPIVASTHTPVTTEIANYVRSLPLSERMSFLSNAIQDGDEVTMNAVLSRPHYLSGLTKEMQAALTEKYNRRRDPVAVKRLDLMKMALARIDAAGPLLVRSIDGLIGARNETVRKLRERSAKTAAALR